MLGIVLGYAGCDTPSLYSQIMQKPNCPLDPAGNDAGW